MDHSAQSNAQEHHSNNETINFNDFLTSLWRSRRVIIGITILGSALGIANVFAFPKYKSEGFFQFGAAIPVPTIKQKNTPEIEPSPGISLSNYKRFSAALNTSGRYTDFITQDHNFKKEDIDELRKRFSTREGISQMIESVYPFTKLDAKELASESKEDNNNVIGLRLSAISNTPESAQRLVILLGRYTMDTIIYLIYSDSLRFKHTEITTQITKLDNKIIQQKELLEKLKRRGSDLKGIISRHPQPANQDSRQIVTVTDDNARYLSPVTQLMTSEVQISEANEAILQAKQEQTKNLLLLAYFQKAKELIDSTKSGETVLRGLEPLKDAIFKDKDMNDEVVREVYNTITIENQTAFSAYLEKSRFTAAPTIPENRADRLSYSIGIGTLAGLLFSIMLVICRNWWIENRNELRN